MNGELVKMWLEIVVQKSHPDKPNICRKMRSLKFRRSHLSLQDLQRRDS